MDVQGVVEQDYEVLKVYRSGDIYVYVMYYVCIVRAIPTYGVLPTP